MGSVRLVILGVPSESLSECLAVKRFQENANTPVEYAE
jgi:hypothetical protein